ncbi:MAG: winged helix-turn-helix transcriptional regulator, partial [Nitrosotalea sp.]
PMPQSVKNAMNSLLEAPHRYTRVLGYPIKKGGGAKRYTKKGNERQLMSAMAARTGSNEMSIYSKFSCIVSGMYAQKESTIDLAFFSRFIPIRIAPPIEYYEDVVKGLEDIQIKPNIEVMNFKFDDYLEFIPIFFEKFRNEPFFKSHKMELGYSTRMIQDIVRIGAFLASIDERESIELSDCIEALERTFNNTINSYKYADLSKLEEVIRQHKDNMTVREIAESVGISPSSVERHMQKLKNIDVDFDGSTSISDEEIAQYSDFVEN